MGDTRTSAPDPIPAAYQAGVNLLAPDCHQVLNQSMVPYFIQAAIATDGYTTLRDLADRWVTKESCRTDSARDYGFRDGDNGYNTASSLRASIRLAQAAGQAKVTCENLDKHLGLDKGSDASVTLVAGQRSQLESHYVTRTGCPKPTLAQQGSDHYLGLQYKACSKGEIGFFTNKQIISQLPERADLTSTRKKRRTDKDGVPHEYDEEERQDPTSMESWKKQMTVFQNSLLMCTLAFPQYAKIQITKKHLDDFYDFIYGEEIATRKPAPSLQVLMIAERNAWREIALKLHSDTPLADALTEMTKVNGFWIREVYERLHHTAAPGAATWGWDSYTHPPSPYRGTRGGKDRNREGKGSKSGKESKGSKTWMKDSYSAAHGADKSAGKAKDKGGKGKPDKGSKGKSKGSTEWKPWPKNWAAEDTHGKQYCRRHHLYGDCAGQCGRSHQCPVYKPDWTPCNGSHVPTRCHHN